MALTTVHPQTLKALVDLFVGMNIEPLHLYVDARPEGDARAPVSIWLSNRLHVEQLAGALGGTVTTTRSTTDEVLHKARLEIGDTIALVQAVEQRHKEPRARRRLPYRGDPETCERCGALFVWAVTLAGENGKGGKAMPLDPIENPDGNVAVRASLGGRMVCRVLHKDEDHDTTEHRAMPHFATCRRA